VTTDTKTPATAKDVYTVTVPKNFVPPKVTPATTEGAATGTFAPADVFYSFRGLSQALTYWLPKGLNESVATARTFRQIVR